MLLTDSKPIKLQVPDATKFWSKLKVTRLSLPVFTVVSFSLERSKDIDSNNAFSKVVDFKVPPPGVNVAMKNAPITINFTILPIPIRIWDLAKGTLFSLTESGQNLAGDYEIYCKISKTKCLLFSHPDKLEFSIPKLIPSDTGYKVIENWAIIEESDLIQEDG